MKKIVELCLFGLLLITGCKANLGNYCKDSNEIGGTELAKSINELKKKGLLDELLVEMRSAENSEETDNILRFINDTDSVVNELKLSTEGLQDLEIIEALFESNNINEFTSKMAKYYPESQNDIDNNIQGDTISYFQTSNNSRGVFSADLEWDTIGWYSSYCLATTAGFIAASYGGIWVRVAGYVAAVAGTASMCTQLAIWLNDDLINDWVSALYEKDSEKATAIADSEFGCQLLALSAATAVPFITGYFCPLGKYLSSSIKMAWNDLVVMVTAHIPSWLILNWNSIGVSITL